MLRTATDGGCRLSSDTRQNCIDNRSMVCVSSKASSVLVYVSPKEQRTRKLEQSNSAPRNSETLFDHH